MLVPLVYHTIQSQDTTLHFNVSPLEAQNTIWCCVLTTQAQVVHLQVVVNIPAQCDIYIYVLLRFLSFRLLTCLNLFTDRLICIYNLINGKLIFFFNFMYHIFKLYCHSLFMKPNMHLALCFMLLFAK